MSEQQQPMISRFNARFLSPEEIVETFVPCDQFKHICEPNNSIVVGPRGSGKTTLFKVLHPVALSSWGNSKAPDYIKTLKFRPIYIPTDINWQSQWEFTPSGEEMREFKIRVQTAAFLSHTLRCTIEALEGYISINPTSPASHLSIKTDRDRIFVFCKEFAITFNIKNIKDYSLTGLKNHLDRRILYLGEVVERLKANAFNDKDKDNSIFYQEIGPTISGLTNLINNYFCKNGIRQWAYMFDELEIAPRKLIVALLNLVRSFNQESYLKLSLVPQSKEYNVLKNTHRAAEGSDHKVIKLYYEKREQSDSFSKKFIGRLFQDHGINIKEAETIFGVSELPSSTKRSGYEVNSDNHKRVLSLYNKDKGFQNWLANKKIRKNDLNNIDTLGENSRASLFRKIIQSIVLRDNYLRNDGTRGSTNQYKLYVGWPSIYSIVDGNPRRLLELIDPLIHEYKESGEQISTSVQAQEIRSAILRFRSLLSTIPVSENNDGKLAFKSILEILDRIGNAFSEQILGDKFIADTSLCFKIDDAVPQEVVTALSEALNQGAIILVNNNNPHFIMDDIRNCVFRLNFMLSPYYRIPIRKDSKSRKLSNLLNPESSQGDPEKNQSELFEYDQKVPQ